MSYYWTLAGIQVRGKSSVCLIFINNYRIIILITGVLSLSAWVKYLYRILQTHHGRTHTRTCAHACAHAWAHTCAHTCTHVHTRARVCTHVYTRAHTCTHVHTHCRRSLTAVQAIAIRWRPTNRDGPLRLRQCRSLAIQINTRTGDPIYPRVWKIFAYKKIARPKRDANS